MTNLTNFRAFWRAEGGPVFNRTIGQQNRWLTPFNQLMVQRKTIGKFFNPWVTDGNRSLLLRARNMNALKHAQEIASEDP